MTSSTSKLGLIVRVNRPIVGLNYLIVGLNYLIAGLANRLWVKLHDCRIKLPDCRTKLRDCNLIASRIKLPESRIKFFGYIRWLALATIRRLYLSNKGYSLSSKFGQEFSQRNAHNGRTAIIF